MIKFSQQLCWIGAKIQISLISCIVKWFYETELQTIYLLKNVDMEEGGLEKGKVPMPFMDGLYSLMHSTGKQGLPKG